MKYKNITEGNFISRPNRFIAHVEVGGTTEIVHVKNTGRCREILIPGTKVYLEISDNPNRKTAYDLIAAEKEKLLINIDSQAPNALYCVWVASHIEGLTYMKREVTHGDSRFDLYYEANGIKTFAEVKGVTLETNGIVRFPDAPTERGIKHLNGLIACVKEGYAAEVIFVVQMKKAKYFCPNEVTHPAFAQKLKEAKENGVSVRVFTCDVLPEEIAINGEIEAKI